MNTLESCIITSPFGEMEECAKFVIDEVSVPFTLHDVTVLEQAYTLGFYIRSESACDMEIAGDEIESTTNWNRYVINFTAESTDLLFNFLTAGTYYIYHPKLEIGNKDTDWTEAPEDVDEDISDVQYTADEAIEEASKNKEQIEYVETLIAKLEDTIMLVVQGLNEGSMMTQTEKGWVFSMGQNKEELIKLSELLNELNNVQDTTSSIVNELKTKVEANDKIVSYVRINESGEQPVINLGTSVDGVLGEFQLQITNTSIQFMKNNDPIAWISNQELHIRKAVVEEELTVGGFVLKEHGERNNVGWIWKGVTS